MAGIEDIIGAFLVGLALNRLIPHTSPLMNRINFVGNALFIPFFLIGVGMLINFAVTILVSLCTAAPPAAVQDMVESVRIPRGAGAAVDH